MSGLRYRVARLPDDAALLIAINAEYLHIVSDGLVAGHGISLIDAYAPSGDIRPYLDRSLPKILGPGPPASIFYIVESDGQIAGMGGLRTVRPGAAEMKRVYLRPEFRGQGRGRALVEQLLADARRLGLQSVFLDTAPTLETAIALYRRLGFADIPPYPEVEVPEVFHAFWVFMGRAL